MKRSASPTLRLGSIAFVTVLATLYSAAGCGGAPAANTAADAQAPRMAEPAGEPQNLGEAERQFVNAERGVFGALNRDKLEAQYRTPQGQFAQPPPGQTVQQPSAPMTTATESSPPPPPYDDRDGETRAMGGDAKSAATGTTAPAASPDLAGASSSPCETACRALASMNRAATHICSLAGDDSDHCTNARERLRAATERVRQSCSECSGG